MGAFADTAGRLDELFSRLPVAPGRDAPALVVDERRARANIAAMCAKAATAGVALRPHFKTHQNVGVGRWFREAGVGAATVSSAGMALRFADDGWNDLLIAVLADPHDLPRLVPLARRLAAAGGRLGLLVDTPAVARAVTAAMGTCPHDQHLKVDTGYGRSGIPWDDAPRLAAVAAAATLAGVVTHAGHSYTTPRAGLEALYAETASRLAAAAASAGGGLRLSAGDTPTCVAARDLAGVDEVRPGNFVFFDVMQLAAGVCAAGDLALAAACPVLAVDAARRRLVLRGGAVHLGKDPARANGGPAYGCLGTLDAGGFDRVLPQVAVTALTQEHAVVDVPAGAWDELADGLRPGDLALVFPSHSCLACHGRGHLVTTTGALLPGLAGAGPARDGSLDAGDTCV